MKLIINTVQCQAVPSYSVFFIIEDVEITSKEQADALLEKLRDEAAPLSVDVLDTKRIQGRVVLDMNDSEICEQELALLPPSNGIKPYENSQYHINKIHINFCRCNITYPMSLAVLQRAVHTYLHTSQFSYSFRECITRHLMDDVSNEVTCENSRMLEVECLESLVNMKVQGTSYVEIITDIPFRGKNTNFSDIVFIYVPEYINPTDKNTIRKVAHKLVARANSFGINIETTRIFLVRGKENTYLCHNTKISKESAESKILVNYKPLGVIEELKDNGCYQSSFFNNFTINQGKTNCYLYRLPDKYYPYCLTDVKSGYMNALNITALFRQIVKEQKESMF